MTRASLKPYLLNGRTRCSLGRRPSGGHKGTFGTVCVIGGCASGSRRYIGAPALAQSSVSVYGRLKVTVESVKIGDEDRLGEVLNNS